MTLPFDTFDDVDYESFECVEDMAGHVFGAMSAQPYLSVVVTGPVSPLWPGTKSNWRPGVGTEADATMFYLRSFPRGRIGRPLDPGEVRMTSIYVEDRTSGLVKLVITLSFLVSHFDMARSDNVEARESYSVAGVPLLSPIIFEDQTVPYDRSGVCVRNGTGHRMVLTSTVHVLHPGSEKSLRSGHHDFSVAAVAAGVSFKDQARQCYEVTTEQQYNQTQMSLLSQLATYIAMHGPDFPSSMRPGLDVTSSSAFSLNAGRVACDMLSAAGLVDIMASPIADGALPDSMLHPLQLPLALTLLTRMAAKPAQYQLKPGTANDAYAARELSEMMESQFYPVLRDPDGEPLWAVDVCATVALTQVKAQILKMKKKKDREAEEGSMDYALKALCSLGVGLCNDVVGCRVPSEIYTEFGVAEQMCGPVEMARAKAASARGLGKLGGILSTMRVSSRAARQRTLVNIMCEVEEFLRSGRCKKIQLATVGAQGNSNARAVQDDDGVVKIPSFEGCDVEATLERATSRDALFKAREQLENILLRGPVVLNAFTVSTYVASRYSKLACVECGSDVDVFGGVVFAQMTSECSSCHGRRCWRCAMIADRDRSRETCRRCVDDTQAHS